MSLRETAKFAADLGVLVIAYVIGLSAKTVVAQAARIRNVGRPSVDPEPAEPVHHQ